MDAAEGLRWAANNLLIAWGWVRENVFSETELWAAFLGAVVGGVISYVLQRASLREAQRQRDDDRKEVRQALANSLVFKMLRIHSNLHGIRQHVEECYEQGSSINPPPEPWVFMRPAANPPQAIHFTADEMGMLLSLGDNNLFGLVIDMDALHNGLYDILRTLSTRRELMFSKLEATSGSGPVFSGTMPVSVMAALRPIMFDVNDLSEHLRQRAEQNSKQADAALDGLVKLFRAELGLRYRIEPKQPRS